VLSVFFYVTAKQTNGNFKRSQLSKVIYKACCWDCNDLLLNIELMVLNLPLETL